MKAIARPIKLVDFDNKDIGLSGDEYLFRVLREVLYVQDVIICLFEIIF